MSLQELSLVDRVTNAAESACKWLIRSQLPRWGIVRALRSTRFIQSKPAYHLSRIRSESVVRQVPKRPPTCLYVETTNLCDAQCIICSHPLMERTKSIMDMKLYERIIDQAVEFGVPRAQLNATGEPLLDKHIFDRIKYAKKRGISYVGLFSNASQLDETKARKLLESGLDLAVLSMDGLTPEEFERVRFPLKFDKVYNNILRICKMKRELGIKKPELRVQITPVDQSIEQITGSDAYRELMEVADRLQFTPPPLIHDWTGKVKGLKEVARVNLPHTRRLPCARLYNTMTVLCDGRVPLCPLDYEGKVELGDLRTQRFTDIWAGGEFRKFRKAHEEAKVAELPLCSTCEHRPSWLEWY